MKKRDKSKIFKFFLTVTAGLAVVISGVGFFDSVPVKAATESIAIIRENCAQKTIPTANCYSSLSAWQAGESRDITLSDEIAVAQIEGAWTNPDTTYTTLSGWTTSATNYIKIYTTADARHSGVWDNTKYRLEITNAYKSAITVGADNVTIDGLQISQSETLYGKGISVTGGGTHTISNNIFKGVDAANVNPSKDDHMALYLKGAQPNAILNVWNNIIYDFERGISIDYPSDPQTLNVYNNTIIGSRNRGVYALSVDTINMKNNIVQGSTNEDYYLRYTGTETTDSNISEDATSPDASFQSKTVTFLDVAADDYHLSDSDTSAINLGQDLSSIFTTDVDGATRANPWDIGADETAVVGTPTPAPAVCGDGVITVPETCDDGNTTNGDGCSSTCTIEQQQGGGGGGDVTAPIISSVSTSNVTDTSVTISWTTDEASDSVVGYSTDTSYSSQQSGASLLTSHSIALSGLTAATTYHYKVSSTDGSGNTSSSSDATFTTSPAGQQGGGGGGSGVGGGNDSTPISNPANAAYVDLTLDAGAIVANAPMKTGVPFPYGALTSVNNVRLENAAGTQEYFAQYDVLANWPDGSVKSLLVQFITDVDTSVKGYRLAYGTSITPTNFGRSIAVTQGTGITVDTGAIKFIINDNGTVGSIWQDSDNDGQFAASEQTVDGSKLYAINSFDGLEYTSAYATDKLLTIEENGPVRAVIKATGSLTNSTGAVLIKYLVRYYAYLGSDKLDVEYTLIDDRLEANVHDAESYRNPTQLALAITEYGLSLHYLNDVSTQYRFGGDAGNVYSGTVSGEQYLLQEGTYTYDNGVDLGNTFTYSGVGTGNRAPGWMALDTGSRHMAITVKDFWQQFPNELNIDNQNVTIKLHPARAIDGAPDTTPTVQGVGGTTIYKRPDTFYFHREGGAKTYRLRFTFADTTPTDSQLTENDKLFQSHNFLWRATPAWYTASGAFGDLNVGGSTSADVGFDAHMMRDFYEPSMVEAKQATNFGWRDYGDRLRAGWHHIENGVRIPSWYNDTHVGATNFFKMYIRTGDQRWYSLAELSTIHFMDIDVSHGPRQGYWSGFGAPTQPAGEIHAIKHDMVDHTSRNVHLGHAHASGLVDLYFLTGDKRAHEVMVEIGEWWRFVEPYMYPLPFDFNASYNKAGYREATRDYGWPLFVMNEYVRMTGDYQYHRDVSAKLIEYLIAWWQSRQERIGYNADTDTMTNSPMGLFNDASQGTGFWTMTRAGNYGAYNKANGCSPWMAGGLIGNIVEFYETDKLMNSAGKASGIDHATLKDMMFQTMNYVVKNGYDAAKDWFVYAETIRTYSGGRSHIIYPLAYLDRLYKQELNAGNITHPEWYDKQSLWGPIAKSTYDDYMNKVARGYTQSYGWYGYEIPHALDFFKIMSEYNSTPTSDTTPPTTTASPAGGTYDSAQSVVLSVDEMATRYYTTDGSDPTTSSSVYSSPIIISDNTTLKFFSVDQTGNTEAIKTETYVINTTVPKSTKFSVNNRVQVNTLVSQGSYLNVRGTPTISGTLLGSEARGNLGTIVGGPVYADGSHWWQVDYDSGIVGWSTEGFLDLYVTYGDTQAPTISAPVITKTTTTATITFTTSETAQAHVDYGLTTSYGSVSNTSSGGTEHSIVITGLSDGTKYNYRVIATDLAMNETQSINYSFTTDASLIADTIAPAQTVNLSANDVSQTSVDTLSWLAPGDDNNVGTAASYDLRYATTTIDESTWNLATRATAEPTPSIAGTKETYALVGLTPGTTYYVALKTSDEIPNISPLSNVATFTTLAPLCTDDDWSYVDDTCQTNDTLIRRWTRSNGNCEAGVSKPQTETVTCSYSASVGGGGGGAPAPTPSTGSGGGGGGIYVDTTPPEQVSDVVLKSADKQISIKWKNPENSDYVRTLIMRKEAKAPTSRTDGEVVFEGTKDEFTDTDLNNETVYYYSIYTYDRRPNYSDPITTFAKPTAGVKTIKIVKKEANVLATDPRGLPSTGSSYTSLLTGQFVIGAKNEQTKLLQQYLARDKEIYPEGITSGYYGTLTIKAVQRFQEKYGIVSSGTPTTTGYGFVGPKTRAKLEEIFGSSKTETTELSSNILETETTSDTETEETSTTQVSQLPSLTGPFAPKMIGDQVKLLQQYLARDKEIYPEGITSGYYGTLTIKAVQRFQEKYGIVSSGTPFATGYGLAGPKTREKIQEILGGNGTSIIPTATTTPAITTSTSTASTERTSALTEVQIDSIVNFLEVFEVEQSIIDRVKELL